MNIILIVSQHSFPTSQFGMRVWQGRVDKKNSLPKIQLKNGIVFYMDRRK